MGIETAILLSVASAGMKIYEGVQARRASKKAANAVRDQAKLKAEQRSRAAQRLSGTQRARFLQSGISLTGDETDTAGSVLGETAQDALQDIELIRSNAQNRSDSLISQGRAQMFKSFASAAFSAASAFAGGLGGGADAAKLQGATGGTGNLASKTLDTTNYSFGTDALELGTDPDLFGSNLSGFSKGFPTPGSM